MIQLRSLIMEASALTDDFLKKIMQWENSIRAGWNSKKKRWFPHKSVEGGTGTIAYGHKLTADDIQTGRFAKGITESEAIELLKSDLLAASMKAKQLVYNYTSLPDNVRQALINAAYRGELKSTHRTTKLMNARRWTAAAAEYLNNAEYRSSPGVRNRMDWNHAQFLTMGKGTPNVAEKPTSITTKQSKIYTVKPGDSLSVIANKYKTTVDKLKQRNQLKTDTIQVGQKLKI